MFARSIAAAGAVNGLAQTLLKLTVPGVPDFYQGTELWDFSLVDPDNRRPVDFARRAAALDDTPMATLAATWRDGRIKQALIARTLALRRRAESLFAHGAYLPVRAEGARADCVVAFLRRYEGDCALVVVPRLPLRLLQTDADIALDPAAWKNTALALDPPPGPLFDALQHRRIEPAARIPLDEICTSLPVALLSTVPPC